MTTIPLRIILHGLLVLVPTPNAKDHITALLADSQVMNANHDHSQQCGQEVHLPKISVKTEASDQCRQAGCTAGAAQCICQGTALIGKRVTLTFQSGETSAVQPLVNVAPERNLPASAAEAGSYSYVANLSHAPFGLTLDPAFLSDTPPSSLAVRVDIPFHTLTACSLSKRDDGGSMNIHSMGFRQLNFPSREDDYNQALAQKVISEVLADADASVTLRISDPDGMHPHDIVLEAGSESYTVDVSNEAASLLPDDPCNDGVARHFAMFYQFSTQSQQDPLLPHARPTQWVSAKNLEPKICQIPVLGPMDRPICPIATFNP